MQQLHSFHGKVCTFTLPITILLFPVPSMQTNTKRYKKIRNDANKYNIVFKAPPSPSYHKCKYLCCLILLCLLLLLLCVILLSLPPSSLYPPLSFTSQDNRNRNKTGGIVSGSMHLNYKKWRKWTPRLSSSLSTIRRCKLELPLLRKIKNQVGDMHHGTWWECIWIKRITPLLLTVSPICLGRLPTPSSFSIVLSSFVSSFSSFVSS